VLPRASHEEVAGVANAATDARGALGVSTLSLVAAGHRGKRPRWRRDCLRREATARATYEVFLLLAWCTEAAHYEFAYLVELGNLSGVEGRA
jgi:hypothetical protein